MKVVSATKEQLTEQVAALRRRVAELEQLEVKRQQTEELYQTLANSSPVGAYIVQDGRFQFVNPQFQKYTGYTKDELLDMESLSIVHPEDRETVRQNAVEMLRGNHPSPYEFRYVRKGGETIWAMETVSSIHYEGKRATLGNFMDITARKRLEESLKESEERYRGLVYNVKLGIFRSTPGPTGRFLEVNPAMEAITGYSREELLQTNVSDLYVDPEQREPVLEEMASARGKITKELRFRKKDGTEIVVSDTKVAVRDGAGKVQYFDGILEDVTERKRMEEQLIVTDRLASIGNLVSGIAHEINNPLTSIIGFSELLLNEDISGNVKEDLRVIHRQAQRAADIVRNFLTSARKHEPTKPPVDINNLIQVVLELRAYEQRTNNIQVNTQFAPDLPKITADGFRLQQVFLSIIINAEYFVSEAYGGGTLTITTEWLGDIIRASFADDGPGITQENLGHIFDPFFTTKEVGQGTGLGLSTCHGIIAEHGGRIYAESKAGKGATFFVELPASTVPTETQSTGVKERG